MSANDFIGRSPRVVRHKMSHVVQNTPTKDEWDLIELLLVNQLILHHLHRS